MRRGGFGDVYDGRASIVNRGGFSVQLRLWAFTCMAAMAFSGVVRPQWSRDTASTSKATL